MFSARKLEKENLRNIPNKEYFRVIHARGIQALEPGREKDNSVKRHLVFGAFKDYALKEVER